MKSNGSSLVALFHKVVSVEGLNTKFMSILSFSGSNPEKKNRSLEELFVSKLF